MQSRTKIIRYKGSNHYLADLLEEKGISHHYQAIMRRLQRGWSINKAIDKPINSYGK